MYTHKHGVHFPMKYISRATQSVRPVESKQTIGLLNNTLSIHKECVVFAVFVRTHRVWYFHFSTFIYVLWYIFLTVFINVTCRVICLSKLNPSSFCGHISYEDKLWKWFRHYSLLSFSPLNSFSFIFFLIGDICLFQLIFSNNEKIHHFPLNRLNYQILKWSVLLFISLIAQLDKRLWPNPIRSWWAKIFFWIQLKITILNFGPTGKWSWSRINAPFTTFSFILKIKIKMTADVSKRTRRGLAEASRFPPIPGSPMRNWARSRQRASELRPVGAALTGKS